MIERSKTITITLMLLTTVIYAVKFDFSEDLGPCRFAPLYTADELYKNATLREEFKWRVFGYEGNFAKDGIGLNIATGMTYDGHGIDYISGLPAEGYLHYWSAPSKESLHLIILTKALIGDQFALRFVCNDCANAEAALEHTLIILKNKMITYQNFNRNFPGFAGFLPWFNVSNNGIAPTWDWQDRVPALDNGEWVWALRAVAHSLNQIGQVDLAKEYFDYFQMLANNVLMVFYGGGGRIRAVTSINNPLAAPSPDNYGPSTPCCCPCFLDDPYEGELMVFFADLYGKWTDLADRNRLWELKLLKLKSVEYKMPFPATSSSSSAASITVQEGWWFSSHEQWKYLELPYLDVDIQRRIFRNGERARSWHSTIHQFGGMFASVSDVTPSPLLNISYLSAVGVPSIAFQPIQKNTTVTPYATFPMFLADEATAMVWYHSMISAPSMQNLFGSTESCNVSGTAISPVLTWDSKISTLGAMLGGIGDVNRDALISDGTYDRFIDIVEREWNLVFKELNGEEYDFALPSTTIPHQLPDFTTCNSYDSF